MLSDLCRCMNSFRAYIVCVWIFGRKMIWIIVAFRLRHFSFGISHFPINFSTVEIFLFSAKQRTNFPKKKINETRKSFFSSFTRFKTFIWKKLVPMLSELHKLSNSNQHYSYTGGMDVPAEKVLVSVSFFCHKKNPL